MILELEEFSTANGLLSPVGKRLRTNFLQRYGNRLEDMYEELERTQRDDLAGIRNREDLSVLEKIGKALESVLGRQDIDLSESLNFSQLGGDSLAATELSLVLEDVFGIEVPVHMLLSPTGSPADWAKVIDDDLSKAGSRATVRSIHGKNASMLDAKDLTLERFLGNDPVSLNSEEVAETTRTVLVTGSTGFLGRFLCLEWLERMAITGGKVICIVRGKDDAAARSRLAQSYAGDTDLVSRFEQLAEHHLEVLAGDVAREYFGLDHSTFTRLSMTVDRIVHPAALVNHMLDYEHLFEPNVVGTAEVLRLALIYRRKHVDLISSIAVTQLIDQSQGILESSPLLSQIQLTQDYGMGYAASKWAAELLVQEAHRLYSLPVHVYRGDMMLAHRRYAGQINVPDIFTRLLLSLIATGIAPRSFYRGQNRHRAHYDGLPVDFIARAVIELASHDLTGIHTYHVSNNHNDGISLDTFVGWLEDEGFHFDRVADYADWLSRFEAKLRSLPESARHNSVLPVLESVRLERDSNQPAVDSSEFLRGLAAASSTGISVPQLTREFIKKCISDLSILGLLGPSPP
jgi:fatty acid CoA ligase FadD9